MLLFSKIIFSDGKLLFNLFRHSLSPPLTSFPPSFQPVRHAPPAAIFASLGLSDIVSIFFIVYRHEENRQRMVNSGVLAATHALAKQATRDQLLRISRVWVAMVQDDDIRWVFYRNVVF